MQNFNMQDFNSSITTRRYFITGSQRLSNFFWASLIFLGGAGFLLTGFSSFLNRGTFSVDLAAPKVLKTTDYVEQSVPSFSTQGSFEPGGPYEQKNQNTDFDPYGASGLKNKEQELLFLQDQNQMGLQNQTSPPSLVDSSYAKEASNFSILPFGNDSIKFFPQGLIMCFYGSSALIFSLYLWLTILWKVGNGFNEFNKETGVVRIFRWGLPGKDRQIDFSYSLKDIEALRVTLKEGINPRRTIALQIKGKGEIPLTRIGEPMALQDIENQASELANFLKIEIQVLAA